MRFLLDENLSPAIAEVLASDGHDSVHVRDVGLSTRPDHEVLVAAQKQGRVLITADADFGEILARSHADGPSVVLLRRQQQRRAHQIAALITANLSAISDDLAHGAIVVMDDERIRIRRLPIEAR